MQCGGYPARRTRFAPVTLYRKRICMPGALDDGELDMEFHEKITGDGEVMEWFLRRQVIHLKKRVVTIPGNASARGTTVVKSLEEESVGRLVPVYLPPHTPSST